MANYQFHHNSIDASWNAKYTIFNGCSLEHGNHYLLSQLGTLGELHHLLHQLQSPCLLEDQIHLLWSVIIIMGVELMTLVASQVL